MRLENFARNEKKILEHNAKESSFKLGHNKMSDWNESEFKATLGGKTVLANDNYTILEENSN
jgi:hypothetical protein